MPKVEVKLNLSALDGLRREIMDAALETMAAVKGEVVTAQVVPFNDGTLEGSMGAIDQSVQEGEIVTSLCVGDTPYARRLYHHPEYNFQKVNNPNTPGNGTKKGNANAQGKWMEPWLPSGEHESFIPETFEDRLRARLDK